MSDNLSFSASAPGRALPQEERRAPVAILLLLIAVVMVPIEFSVTFGTVTFTAARAFLCVLTLVMLPHLGQLKLRLFDWFFVAHVGWTCMAFLIIYSPPRSIEMSGSYALEMLVVYLAARVYLQTVEQMLSVVRLLLLFVVIAGLVALPEALTGKQYVRDISQAITGNSYPMSSEIRMGIYRASSFFEHPILYGVFCASVFSLMWFTSTPMQRLWMAPVVGFATWLSASSAPLLVLVIQLGLLVAERVSRMIPRRDKIFGLAIGAFVFAMEAFTGRGIMGTIPLLTLTPNTAWTRVVQWDHGIDDVLRNPIIGFDAAQWTRPSWLAGSIDNWWLLMMMRAGFPSIIFMFLAAFFIWAAIARRTGGPPLFVQLRTGWALMMFGLILAAWTVTYFGKLQPLFAFYMGLGAALATCAFPEPRGTETQAPAGQRGIAYTRFPKKVGPAVAIRAARAERTGFQSPRSHRSKT